VSTLNVPSITFSLDVILPKIIEIGMARLPNEACGLVVPDLDEPAAQWVHELQNRSKDPLNSYAIDPMTIYDLRSDRETWSSVLVWHTHPSGHVGPSQQDWDDRLPDVKYLVVALPGGQAVMF
jgi:proteasome lid subunit RPN8/RPN11